MSDERAARVVADADVLAADLLLDGSAREVLDQIRAHSWLYLIASDPLLDDAEAVIDRVGSQELAAEWRECIEDERERVSQPEGDHPGLASAYRGDAAHLLTFDPDLASTETNLAVEPHTDLSIRSPEAFAAIFDAAALYESLHEDAYPGLDRNK